MRLSDVLSYTLVHATLRSTTPILLATIAAVISKQANVINMGIEGIMLFGAYTGYVAGYFSGSWVVGVLAGMLVGVLLGMLVGCAHLRFRAHILVVGFAVNMLALGMTRFMLQQVFGVSGALVLPDPVSIPSIHIRALESSPVLSSLFSDYCILEPLSVLVVVGLWLVLYKTAVGLRLRSVGLNETSAMTAGISIERNRFVAITLSGLFAGLAGAYLSMGYSTMFVENMTSGRGYMALAAMNFGGGNPLFAMGGALIFGFMDSVGARLQSFGFPSQFVLMLPYLTTVLVLTIAMVNARRKEKAMILKQYRDGERAVQKP